ncbi:MAG: transglutaminase family protein [Actinomycetota bacterium]
MGIHVGIEHRTSYRFDRPIEIHPHVIRLRPAPHCRTPIDAYSLTVEPPGHFLNWQQDPFGNHLARLVFPEPADHLAVTVDLIADLTVINPFDFFVEESAETFPFAYEPDLARDLEPYLRTEGRPGPLLQKLLAEARPEGGERPIGTVDYLVELNRLLYSQIEYSVRMEPGVQDPEATLARQVGSCRDTGWLLVDVLRRLGLAARFVSGYLIQLAPDRLAGLDRAFIEGPDGPTEDFTDLHAWAEAYVPGAGWVGLDPTSGLLAGEGHIPLACTPNPVTAAPITGATAPAEVTFDFANTVHRVREDPRVTLPYPPDVWKRIDRLGRQVDARLTAGDVRLTMGGEPTFVSIDDPDGPEWNIAADGPEKRRLALDLAGRLKDRFGPGGLIQHGQGKWYPGEPLPRWQIGVVWRHDGQPLWRDPELLASPDQPGERTSDDARALALAIAERFGLADDLVLPAWEDPVDEAWREARLPAGRPPEADVSPDEADRRNDPDARTALVERLAGDQEAPVGFVLPLHPAPDGPGWLTSRWHLRRDRLYLIPGDSPIGLRLPLDSLTWSPDPPVFERSPYEPRPTLGEPDGRPDPVREVARNEIPPTALAVEVVDGQLRIFLPPLERAEEAVELLAAIEAVVTELGWPVVLEGYPLPRDPRLATLVVTPDPGVIEVNVHPSADWAALRDVVGHLYTEAKLTRLGTEKFAIDGAHTGTGGGNHITLGGATPADSPLLRRPDLLVSMITYWQHHPALSYLFSGQFIGPTSQAPRVDEGRADNLYELEIAFAELARQEKEAPPWMVDRLLRNLLVDLTGNTHRAEFCIDKLYSPESERGRLGLLELRAMEMPPHPNMALVQALLLRALVARFWDSPYSGRLVRWGPDLHDRFLLPWFVRLDINDVVADLVANDIAFDRAWLEPFLEFRFPLIGERELDDTRIELRGAIEPWHVLGEEMGAAGTARYVDSSVERLQVLVEGFNETRHVLTCNRVPVPLQPTSVPGVGVAGIRFKAWAPHSSLHPTIGVHDPLVFDLVDRWSERSLGGCTYRVSHPGGRAYDTRPVNAAEAEARRVSRFFTHGHTPGRVDVAALDAALANDVDRDHRRTLDLRRFPEAREGR